MLLSKLKNRSDNIATVQSQKKGYKFLSVNLGKTGSHIIPLRKIEHINKGTHSLVKKLVYKAHRLAAFSLL